MKKKVAILAFVTVLFTFSCEKEKSVTNEYLIKTHETTQQHPLTENEKKSNEFFLNADDNIIKEFIETKGEEKKMGAFYQKYNLPSALITPSELATRQSCSGNECDKNYVGKTLSQSFMLDDIGWRKQSFNELLDVLKASNYTFKTPIGVPYGNSACVHANNSTMKAKKVKNIRLMYGIGPAGYHGCNGTVRPLPVFLYSGETITTQIGCSTFDEIYALAPSVAASLGIPPLYHGIAEDGSGIMPGIYKFQYGTDGLGTPNGGNDAVIETYFARNGGVK
ncbi:MAG TPA: hypothetical protein PLW93_02070 [Candidatus Absconditabacterales bacterium]|nr:hypothetical protein [Candidatus Absconditabacterales bacterium]HNG97036.1 hypothetical protein [Candidatus Absconditabacterales bacterium]